MRVATWTLVFKRYTSGVSTHATRAGRDIRRLTRCVGWRLFQLTRPVRVATPTAKVAGLAYIVSTHATRAGRDTAIASESTHPWCFNSRDPCGSRRDCSVVYCIDWTVSTHATRAGRDNWHSTRCPGVHSFNSRDPCGSRPHIDWVVYRHVLFQLTRPVRVATNGFGFVAFGDDVSTHATRAGRDDRCGAGRSFAFCFNSRDPCGSRL